MPSSGDGEIRREILSQSRQKINLNQIVATIFRLIQITKPIDFLLNQSGMCLITIQIWFDL